MADRVASENSVHHRAERAERDRDGYTEQLSTERHLAFLDLSSRSIGLGKGYGPLSIDGYYRVDADSLDAGTMEIQYSPDGEWIDILHDSVFAPLVMWSPVKPTFTGWSNGWKYFHGEVSPMAWYIHYTLWHNIEPQDTIRWRFTFISDSIDTPRDGLMFDSFRFVEYNQGITEHTSNTFHSQVAPMPVSEDLTLIYETAGLSALILTIQDARGVVVRREGLRALHRSTFDVQDLRAGPYFYSLQSQDGEQCSLGWFVKD